MSLNALSVVLASLASSHVTLLVKEGSIFAKPRRWLGKSKLMAELLSCNMCLGFWVAVAVGWWARLGVVETLAVAGLAYLVTTAREKYLPCESCKEKPVPEGTYTFYR